MYQKSKIYYLENDIKNKLIYDSKMSEQMMSSNNVNNAQSDNTQMFKKTVELTLPNDPKMLGICLANLYSGLNKANKSGVYDLSESYQLRNNLEVLSQLIMQINKNAYKQE
jgi:hypothetical protein